MPRRRPAPVLHVAPDILWWIAVILMASVQKNAKNCGVAIWKRVSPWEIMNGRIPGINQRLIRWNCATRMEIALNALATVNGAVVNPKVIGTQNTARTRTVGMIMPRTVRICGAVVSHGIWKNRTVQMARPRFCKVADGRVPLPKIPPKAVVNPVFAERLGPCVGQSDRCHGCCLKMRPCGRIYFLQSIICFSGFLCYNTWDRENGNC